MTTATTTQHLTDEQINEMKARLEAATGLGVTFGYIGNCSSNGLHDDRSWMFFLKDSTLWFPAGKVLRADRITKVGGYATEQYAECLPGAVDAFIRSLEAGRIVDTGSAYIEPKRSL